MLCFRALAFVPMQRPGRAGKQDDGLAAPQVIVISANRARSGGSQMEIRHVPEEIEGLRWGSKAETACVAIVGEFRYLNLHVGGFNYGGNRQGARVSVCRPGSKTSRLFVAAVRNAASYASTTKRL